MARADRHEATGASSCPPLGVSSPSVLDMAGYSEEATVRVMEMLADITDEDIQGDAVTVTMAPSLQMPEPPQSSSHLRLSEQ